MQPAALRVVYLFRAKHWQVKCCWKDRNEGPERDLTGGLNGLSLGISISLRHLSPGLHGGVLAASAG